MLCEGSIIIIYIFIVEWKNLEQKKESKIRECVTKI